MHYNLAFKLLFTMQIFAATTKCINIGNEANIPKQNAKNTVETQNKSMESSTLIQGLLIPLGVGYNKTRTAMKSVESNNNTGNARSNSLFGQLKFRKENFTEYFSNYNLNVKTTEHNIFSFISRGNILRYYSSNTNYYEGITQSPFYGSFSYKQASCSSCEMLEQAKLENLESIKMHILMRLQLTKLPNIPAPIPVPHNILQKFYEKYSASEKQNHYQEQVDSTYQKEGDDSKLSYKYKRNDSGLTFQNDDPGFYYKSQENFNEKIDNKKEDYNGFFSTLEKFYVFPSNLHSQHNRRTDIINFTFVNQLSIITRAIIHIYIRGREWIRINRPKLLEQVKFNHSYEDFQEIIIVISQAIRCPDSLNFTHSIKLIESRQKIPNGIGKWVQIELKQLASYSTENHNTTFGIIVKGTESWMHHFIVTNDTTQHNTYSAHIELHARDSHRIKRSTSLDCQESENEVRCCRYPLKVNFTDFGWHFVVAPTSFEAYFCNGECKVGYLEQYTHTHIASLTTSAKPCCSPTKMSPLSLLYFNFNQILMHSTIPNMSVEKCSCS